MARTKRLFFVFAMALNLVWASATLQAFTITNEEFWRLCAGWADIKTEHDDNEIMPSTGASLIYAAVSSGVNINFKNQEGLTALQAAASRNTDLAATAILLFKGADTAGVTEAAAQNPNPEVRRLVEYFLAHPEPEPGLPLFTDPPATPALRQKIKNLDAQIRDYAGQGFWYDPGLYVAWQSKLASDLKAYSLLGRTPEEAWVTAYESHLENVRRTVEPDQAPKTTVQPARLVVSGNYGTWPPEPAGYPAPEFRPWYLVNNRKIVVTERPSGWVGHEAATGNELWRNPNIDSPHFLLRDVIFNVKYIDDTGLRQVIAVDAADGRTLWQVWGSNINWAVDAQKNILAIDYANGLALFDFNKWADGNDGWIQDIKDDYIGPDWEERSKQFEALKKNTLGQIKIKLQTGDTLPAGLWAGTEEPPVFDLGANGQAFATNALAVDESGFFNFSVWGPDREMQNPDSPLLLYDRIKNEAYHLQISNGATLTGHNLKRIQSEYDTTFAITFSPAGSYLAITEPKGSVHFFSARERGKHLGSLSAETKIANGSSVLTVKDLSLNAILDDSPNGQPICGFTTPGPAPTSVVVTVKLKQGAASPFFSPSPSRTNSITAFALSPKDAAAVGLADGSVFFIDSQNGKPQKVQTASGTAWTAMTFSGDGETLVGANEAGEVFLIGSKPQLLASGFKNIRQMIVDAKGARIWFLRSDNDEGAELTLLKTGQPKLTTSYKVEGAHSFLSYNSATDMAQLVQQILQQDDDTSRGCYESYGEPALSDSTVDGAVDAVIIKTSDCLTVPLDLAHPQGVGYAYNDIIGISPDNSSIISEGYYEMMQYRAPHYFTSLTGGARGAFENSTLTPSYMETAFFSHDGHLVALAEEGATFGGRFFVYNSRTGDLLSAMSDGGKQPLGIRDGAFLSDPARLFTVGQEGALRLWDLKGREPVNLLTWVFFKTPETTKGKEPGGPQPEINWVIIDQDYRFDTPDLDKLDGVHWIARHKPGTTVALASLMRDYYQPRLAEYVLAGRQLPALADFSGKNLTQHGVRLVSVKDEPDNPGQVAVTVELRVRGDDPIHPAQDLKLFRDGRLVAQYDGLIELPEGQIQHTFHNIALPRGQGAVMFKGYAFNSDRVRSKYFDREYKYSPTSKPAPRLHLIAVGINEFDNQAWNLKYAVNDARAFAEKLPEYLDAEPEIQVLIGGDDGIKPSKENLREAIMSLASASGSNPDDVVLLTIASHGLTAGRDNQFYILPADIPGQDQSINPELLSSSISADELSRWLSGVDAGEMVLIIDTCQSGAALGGETFKPGPMGDKGLGQLAYDKAMRVLSATNEDNAAMEINDLGHGLLSYALLIDGLDAGQASPRPGEPVSLEDWLNFGQEHTVELYAKIISGQSLGTTRGKLKVDKSAGGANPPLGQEPYLFDFGGPAKCILKAGGR